MGNGGLPRDDAANKTILTTGWRRKEDNDVVSVTTRSVVYLRWLVTFTSSHM